MPDRLFRTALYARHVAAGAKLASFAGWEMPIRYAGVQEEHIAVRRGVGAFDVSHMGEIETRGAQALALLQRLLSNDLARVEVGGAQYSVVCNEHGGVLDDVFTYRLERDRYLTVTNAANHEKDLAWFRQHASDFDAEIRDAAGRYAMLAIQGPQARALLGELAEGELPTRFRIAEITLAGVPVLACGTGYTGEDGVELLLSPRDVEVVWDAVVARGAVPCGLAARDTLRLEVCFHLYGNDLMESRGPIEAGLAWCCKEDTGFIGADAVRAVRERGPAEMLVPFVLTGPGIARQGHQVKGGGEVTSGTFSPSMRVGIGMAYLPVERAREAASIEIDVRGRTRSAAVVSKPIYRPKAA
jgi:aminomethyltransferase